MMTQWGTSSRKVCRIRAVVGVTLLAAGCGLGPNGSAEPTYHQTPFLASDFVDPLGGSNQWFALNPGVQLVREGTTLIGNRKVPYQVITTVTDVIRVISGVPTVLVYDRELGTGQVTQRSLDYLAQDTTGNIWVMGGATETFEAGRFVEVDDVWMSGVDGAEAGILMPADPGINTPAWVISRHRGEESVAEYVATQKNCVPFGCFEKVLVTREGTPSAPDNEFKYYAFGLGQIRNEPRGDSRHDDTEVLINATQLSAHGLTEVSREALNIDGQAAEEWPKFYSSVEATRKP